MDYKTRMELVRLNGPRRPLLRHVLLVLALYDGEDGDLVFGGRLEQETGYSDRAIRGALRQLVLMGWLKPEKAASASDPRMVSCNQYGASANDRVHGHLGGCRAGGKGARTRYWITYRSEPAPEPERKRKAKKGERGAAQEGGTGRRDLPPCDDTRGNGAPWKGERGANKGEPRSPYTVLNRDRKIDAGGIPPPPPSEAGSGPPYGGPGSPLAAADAADCPQDSLPGADAPDCPQGTQDRPGGARQLRERWPDVIATVRDREAEKTGIRLWLDTPKVKPLHVTGPVLHVGVPSIHFVKALGRYSASIATAVSDLAGLPVEAVVYHPAKEVPA